MSWSAKKPALDYPVFTGQDIYEWRTRLGLTGEQAAAALGVAANTFWGYEYGRRSISEPVRRMTVYVEKYGVLK